MMFRSASLPGANHLQMCFHLQMFVVDRSPAQVSEGRNCTRCLCWCRGGRIAADKRSAAGPPPPPAEEGGPTQLGIERCDFRSGRRLGAPSPLGGEGAALPRGRGPPLAPDYAPLCPCSLCCGPRLGPSRWPGVEVVVPVPGRLGTGAKAFTSVYVYRFVCGQVRLRTLGGCLGPCGLAGRGTVVPLPCSRGFPAGAYLYLSRLQCIVYRRCNVFWRRNPEFTFSRPYLAYRPQSQWFRCPLGSCFCCLKAVNPLSQRGCWATWRASPDRLTTVSIGLLFGR